MSLSWPPDHDYRKMRKPIKEYTWCSAYFKNRRSKNQTVYFREILLSAEIRIPPEQRSPEHPPPKSSRTPQEEPHFVVLSAGATFPLLLRSLTTTLEQIALREILLLEEILGLSAPARTPF
jgi:hypothetical protein